MITSPQCNHKKKACVIMRCTTKATIKDTGDCVCTFLATSLSEETKSNWNSHSIYVHLGTVTMPEVCGITTADAIAVFYFWNISFTPRRAVKMNRESCLQEES